MSCPLRPFPLPSRGKPLHLAVPICIPTASAAAFPARSLTPAFAGATLPTVSPLPFRCPSTTTPKTSPPTSSPNSPFSAGIDIRQFLARLLTLVAKGRISPRCASVLAYITNQLLHSNRAITLESPPAKEQPRRIIIDMPEPNHDWPVPEPEPKPRPENPTYADLRS